MSRFLWLFFYVQFASAVSLECQKDTDCVLRPAKCCSCHQGGKLKAVYKNTPKPDCGDRICAQVISKDKSCQAKQAVCLHQQCQLQF